MRTAVGGRGGVGARGVVLTSGSATLAAATPHGVEAVLASPAGGVMIAGWIDDTDRPLTRITVVGAGRPVVFEAAALSRHPRAGQDPAHGFLGFVFEAKGTPAPGPCEIQFRFRDGGAMTGALPIRGIEDGALRHLVLSRLVGAGPVGGAPETAIASLARGLGDQIVTFNRAITRAIVAGPHSERFAGPPRAYRGSIIVCLYGRAEYQFIQSALFSGKPGIEHYEFIYVCNSPEMAETLLGNGRNAQRVYGLDQTIIILPGNAGFGAANTLAAQSARSDRILFVNPDVFPRDPAWAERHTEVVETRPHGQTDLFGAPLHYDDGALMHGGMYFESDSGMTFDRGRAARWSLLRVEHYGKGAPPDAPALTRARPVPAVSGAFISMARPWFERLGGFTEDYVYGHYEDADLCLKSLEAGTPAWLQDVRMWHLEGKGAARAPAHEGGALVNRWLFSTRWGELVSEHLMGPRPSHPLLAEAAP